MYDVIPYEAQPLATRWNYAEMLSQAGDLIPKSLQVAIRNDSNAVVGYEPSPGKVMLVMEVGASLGLHPTAALANVYVIEGRVSMSAQLMVAVIRRAGHTIRVETVGKWGDAAEPFLATATLTRTDDLDHTYRVVWSRERAERAGLLGKDNWQHYPEALCVARATSEVARQGGSDVLLGIGYTPEELGASVDAGGNMLGLSDLQPEVTEPEPEAKPQPTARARKAPTKGRQGTKRAEPEPEEQAAPTEVSVTIAAGEEIADGPMAGITPTAEQVAGAEAELAARQHIAAAKADGVDTDVAEQILAAEIPAEPASEPEVNEQTGEVTETPLSFAESAWTYAMSVNEGEDVPRGADLSAYVLENASGKPDMMAVWTMASEANILSTDLRMALINAGSAAAARATAREQGDQGESGPAVLAGV